MRLEPNGDQLVIVRGLEGASPAAWARAISSLAISGVVEATAAYESVGVYVDPLSFREEDLLLALESARPEESSSTNLHVVPVCYEMGEDLAEAASLLELNTEELIAFHLAEIYTCFAVGFQPGFGYLGYLTDRIARVPRRPEPRLRVEAGSVGITGRQTGVYPQAGPGGWALIGRTPLPMVDLQRDHFLLSAGDRVQFRRITQAEYAAQQEVSR